MKRIKLKIKRLTAEIDKENKKLDSLLQKFRNKPDALWDLPEFTDPVIVVPQTCKRQLVIFLKSKLKGMNEKGCLKAVVFSRFDGNLFNPLNLSSDDFRDFLKKSDIGLPDLCKEILKKEQNPEGNKTKQKLINKLVDEYFAKQKF